MARVRDLETQVGQRDRELERARAEAGEARNAEIAAYRRALVAEHAKDGIIPDLVVGATREEVEASLPRAKAAFEQARQAALSALVAQGVPIGNPAREAAQAAAVEELSPAAKIAYGLRQGS
jgi:hypothetical protein